MAEAKLSLIEHDDHGNILIRWRKPNGEWHRTSVAPGADPAVQIAAVQDHLSKRGQDLKGSRFLCDLAADDNALIGAFAAAARAKDAPAGHARLKRIVIDDAKGDLHVTLATADGKSVPTWITPDVDLAARLNVIDGELKADGGAGISEAHVDVIDSFLTAARARVTKVGDRAMTAPPAEMAVNLQVNPLLLDESDPAGYSAARAAADADPHLSR